MNNKKIEEIYDPLEESLKRHGLERKLLYFTMCKRIS